MIAGDAEKFARPLGVGSVKRVADRRWRSRRSLRRPSPSLRSRSPGGAPSRRGPTGWRESAARRRRAAMIHRRRSPRRGSRPGRRAPSAPPGRGRSRQWRRPAANEFVVRSLPPGRYPDVAPCCRYSPKLESSPRSQIRRGRPRSRRCRRPRARPLPPAQRLRVVAARSSDTTMIRALLRTRSPVQRRRASHAGEQARDRAQGGHCECYAADDRQSRLEQHEQR